MAPEVEISSLYVASVGLSVSGTFHDFVIFKRFAGTAGLTHNASGMEVLAAGTEDGEGTATLTGNWVAGAQAARIVRQIKVARIFFICLFCHKWINFGVCKFSAILSMAFIRPQILLITLTMSHFKTFYHKGEQKAKAKGFLRLPSCLLWLRTSVSVLM
jgi:hypothetical protein